MTAQTTTGTTPSRTVRRRASVALVALLLGDRARGRSSTTTGYWQIAAFGLCARPIAVLRREQRTAKGQHPSRAVARR